jgi:hypothetical protein
LLRTALAEPDHQLVAWQHLGPGFNLGTLEPGSISVLPLVYRNLSRSLPADPRLPHLKGVYRSAWVKNNLLVEQLAAALDSFASAGVETVLLGSLGAALRYFPELGLRPTPALEFVVGGEALLRAWRALGRLGWSTATSSMPGGDRPIDMVNRHGQVCVVRPTAAVELSLDYNALQAASGSVQIGSCQVRVPCPEHDLLAACAAGGRMKPVPSVQWLVDMARIAQTAAPRLDWEKLLGLAGDQAQTLRLCQAMTYLEGSLGVRLPATMSPLPDTAGVAVRERVAYRCAGISVPGVGSLPQAIGEHIVATRARPGIEAVITFPGFMRRRWELNHWWQLPLAGIRRVAALVARGPKPKGHQSVDRAPG